MTLSVLEVHSPIASILKCDISYLWRVARSLCICRASCHSRDPDFEAWILCLRQTFTRFLCPDLVTAFSIRL